MSDRNLLVECSQCGGRGGRRISVNDHNIGADLIQDIPHSGQDAGCDIVKILSGLHDIQIVVRSDFKQIQDLVQHLPVLGRYADDRFEMNRICLKRLDERCHFDCFVTLHEYEQVSCHVIIVHSVLFVMCYQPGMSKCSVVLIEANKAVFQGKS